MKRTSLSLVLLFTVLVLSGCQQSEKKELHLNALFTDHMVLQQKKEVAFWGSYTPNEEITVHGSWGCESTSVTDAFGQWKLSIATPKAGGPYEVTIRTKSTTISIKDVLIGEVWLASGQSNMEMDFDYCCNTTDFSELERATANYPNIRMINVKKQLSLTPVQEFKGTWKRAVGNTISPFSAASR